MQKDAVDLDNADLHDLEVFNGNTLEVPRIDDQSDSHSFRNNPYRDNMMFSSPMRRALVIGQPTPGPLSCLGFTPWTPKDVGNINPDHSTAKTELKGYQQLNFD